MSLADDLTADALAAITDLDSVFEAMTLRKDSGGTFDPNTGAYTSAPSPSDSGFRGYAESFDVRAVDGATILEGDLSIIGVSFQAGVEPIAGDQVLRGGRSYRLVSSGPVTIAGSAVLYQMHARGV